MAGRPAHQSGNQTDAAPPTPDRRPVESCLWRLPGAAGGKLRRLVADPLGARRGPARHQGAVDCRDRQAPRDPRGHHQGAVQRDLPQGRRQRPPAASEPVHRGTDGRRPARPEPGDRLAGSRLRRSLPDRAAEAATCSECRPRPGGTSTSRDRRP